MFTFDKTQSCASILKRLAMNNFLKQLIGILKKNTIYHTIETAGATDKMPYATDTYTVFYFSPQDSTQAEANTENAQCENNINQAEVAAVPLIEIRHNKTFGTLGIFLNQIQIFHFSNFKHNYKNPGLTQHTQVDITQTQLNDIMDVCIKKSNRTHMLQLRQINQVLKENNSAANKSR